MNDSKKESVVALYHSMICALDNPTDYAWLISKCGSQAALASVEKQTKGIQAMTINTFKKYSDAALDGGFGRLDELRIVLKKRAQNGKNEVSREKKKDIAFYKEKVDEAERLRAILIRAYTELNRICLEALKKSPEYKFDLDRHSDLYREYFALRLVDKDD
ncbi:hypothetical protein [Vreelandella titanicae]|uniref:hypothetical protein n=1 Tax=Vreelandella titanicae TaxID=664683 RepID=UPI001593BEAA|nr:hypothetical protein [Halomonas titanicae]NVE90726.1 hypothetical protein [Halomonas titanicae]